MNKDWTDKKVIVCGNDNTPFVVGKCFAMEHLNGSSLPLIKLNEDDREILSFGIILLYSKELEERLSKLTPTQQYELAKVLKNEGSKKKFILMRGIPGAGKSFKAKQLVGNDGQIFSTDDYWYMKSLGVRYDFDIIKLGKAHKWNQRRVLAAVEANIPTIIIDNTNTTIREMRDYYLSIELAILMGYDILIEEPETSWAFDADELFKRNSHNVPKEIIDKMLKRYVKDVKIEDILFY